MKAALVNTNITKKFKIKNADIIIGKPEPKDEFTAVDRTIVKNIIQKCTWYRKIKMLMFRHLRFMFCKYFPQNTFIDK